ncbi:MAG: GIY-YIG nuclease family protein [Candidatus Poribacteria bacterium]|nr:GIY-YIG nuclease family protein [Candidatus Poribacteria bacterium]
MKGRSPLNNNEINAKTVKVLAERCWWQKATLKQLALKFKLTEEQVDELRATTEYRTSVFYLMLGQRSAEDFEKWVATYPDMNNRFGRRMGLPPKVVAKMVADVRNAHAAGAVSALNLKKIANPSKKMNLNAEKTIGAGRHSVYLYYDQHKRVRAESKGETFFPCKIGRTTQELHTRIYQQDTTVAAERFKLGLHIKTEDPIFIEQIIHETLKARGQHIDDAPGREWFLTAPSDVERILEKMDKEKQA